MLEINPNEAVLGKIHIGKVYTQSIDIKNPLSCAVEFEIRPVIISLHPIASHSIKHTKKKKEKERSLDPSLTSPRIPLLRVQTIAGPYPLVPASPSMRVPHPASSSASKSIAGQRKRGLEWQRILHKETFSTSNHASLSRNSTPPSLWQRNRHRQAQPSPT